MYSPGVRAVWHTLRGRRPGGMTQKGHFQPASAKPLGTGPVDLPAKGRKISEGYYAAMPSGVLDRDLANFGEHPFLALR